MNLKKIITLLLAVSMLCVAYVVPSLAETTPYEEAMARYEKMKRDYINICIEYAGMYTTKASRFYGREVIGVNPDGSYQLSPWRCLTEASYVLSGDYVYFNVPATYVHFGYSLDIMWGTDWPYSGILWTCPNGEIAKKIDIYATGLVRLVEFFIKVNDYPVFSDMNCDSHSEWRP